MAYLKAATLAVLAALLAGAATGVVGVIGGAMQRLRPEDKAVVLAEATSEAMNNAAFFLLLLLPLTVALALSCGGGAGGRQRVRRSRRDAGCGSNLT